MKEKVLIVAGSLRIGGIEKSLLNLLKSIDYNKYEVDLFLYSNTGEYIKELPSEVNLISRSRLLNCVGLTRKEANNTKKKVIIIARTFLALLCRLVGFNIFYKLLFIFISSISKQYDVAISYVHNVGPKTLYTGYNKFVLTKTNAKKKIAWIHSDYEKAGFNNRINNEEYKKFDAIVNVSVAGKKAFDNAIPEMKNRSHVVYNMFPIRDIKLLSNDKISLPINKNSGITIVTVARIDENKSIDRIIRVANNLRNNGFKFSWYIVGEGNERSKLELLIDKLKLKEIVYFLGSKENPYPYIKGADLFVLSSKYEGMPMVITESLILGTPVLVTEYDASVEQIKNGYNGIIVENSEEGISNELVTLLADKGQLQTLKSNLLKENHSNDLALKQFESLLNLQVGLEPDKKKSILEGM